MEEEGQAKDFEVMDTTRFLDHPTCMYLRRTHLTDIFDQKQHWVFAMTAQCGAIALQLNQLHMDRCGGPIEMVIACCVKGCPAFFLFPKESLAYGEITELLDVQVAGSQAEAERMAYFVLAMEDPGPLSQLLHVWVHQEHFLS
jgi:hypothetical protein